MDNLLETIGYVRSNQLMNHHGGQTCGKKMGVFPFSVVFPFVARTGDAIIAQKKKKREKKNFRWFHHGVVG